MHQRILIGRISADADANNREIDAVAQKAGEQTAMGARAARADHHAVDLHALLEELLLQLLRAGNIAQTAQGIGAAAGNDVGLAAHCSELVGDPLHRGRHVGAGGHDLDVFDAHQPEHEVIAAGLIAEGIGHPLLDDEAALQTLPNRCGQGNAAVVRLRRAAGHQRVGTLGQRIGHQELEFAGLVAAGSQTELVIALDPDLRATQCLRKARHEFERRGAMGIDAAGKAGEVHRQGLQVA